MYLLYQLLFYPFFLYSFHFHQATTPCSQNIYTFSLLYPLLILPNFIQIFFFLYLKFFCNAVVSACQPNHILCFYFFFKNFKFSRFRFLRNADLLVEPLALLNSQFYTQIHLTLFHLLSPLLLKEVLFQ